MPPVITFLSLYLIMSTIYMIRSNIGREKLTEIESDSRHGTNVKIANQPELSCPLLHLIGDSTKSLWTFTLFKLFSPSVLFVQKLT